MMTLGERMEREYLAKAEKGFAIRGERIEKETREKAEKKLKEKIALKLIDEGLDITMVVRCSDLSHETVERLKREHGN